MVACAMSIDGIIWFFLSSVVSLLGCEDMLSEKVSGELEMLGRHLVILKCVVENEPIGILKLAEVTKIPSHKVRYSLRVLEREGLIAASAPGAITTERTGHFLEELESMIDNFIVSATYLKKIKFPR